MQGRILGPVELDRLRLSGQRRAIVAVLLVRRGSPISSLALADELWGETPPPTAIKSVQVRIAELRRELPPGVLVTKPDGYAFAGVALDADRFEAEVAAGRHREALALWRGPALDGVDTPLVRIEAARLDELRLLTIEAWAAAALEDGRDSDLVPELEALVLAQPLRERSRALLMRALYRARRQADALAVYRDGRALLNSELGLEPGPELRALELAVLRQDPALDAPPPERGVAPAPRRRLRLAAGALALGAVVAALATAAGEPDGARERVAPPGSVAVIDPRSNAVTGTVAIGGEPVALAVGAGAVWAADAAGGTIAQIDSRRWTVTRHVGTGKVPSAIAAGRDTVWVANSTTGASKGTVSRIPVATGVAATTVLSPNVEYVDFGPPTPSALAITPAGVWVNDIRRRLALLSPAGEPLRTVSLGSRSTAERLALGAGALWAASAADDTVVRLDPASGAVQARIPVAAAPGGRVAGPSAVAVGFGSVWAADTLAGAMSRIDPRLNAVTATIRVGGRPSRIAAGEGAVWVLDGGSVVKLDPARNAVVARIAVGDRAIALAVGAGAVWVGVPRVAGPRLARPATLRRVTAARWGRPAGAGPLLVVSDLPQHFDPNGAFEIPRMEAAIRWVFERRGFRAGRHAVAYQACDDSTPELVGSDHALCEANARAFAAARSVVGVIGPFKSDCARAALPILNAAAGGPLAAIGPLNTYVGLTRSGPGTPVDEPERLYPTRVRSFVRLTGPDDAQGAALATLADRLGARSVYVIHDGQAYGAALSSYVQRAAAGLGLRVTGTSTWDPRERGYRSLARSGAATGADAVVVLGCQCDNGRRLLVDLRRAFGPGVPLLVSDGFSPPNRYSLPAAAGSVYMTTAGVHVDALDARGRALAADLSRALKAPVGPSTLAAVIAAETLLDAIAHSDGTRASINAALRRSDADTIAGRVRFDAGGDLIDPRFMITRSDPRVGIGDTGIYSMVFDRMITPGSPDKGR